MQVCCQPLPLALHLSTGKSRRQQQVRRDLLAPCLPWPVYVRRERKETSFSSRRQSHTLAVSSLLALTKKAPLLHTARRLTALQAGEGGEHAACAGGRVQKNMRWRVG